MEFRREINNTVSYLNDGKTILYPTDTVWGIGCDATDENAVKKIYSIKQREQSKSLIILVDSFDMLQKYITEIPKEIKYFLANESKPTTVIYNNPIDLAINTIANDNTIAIRIVKNTFCNLLIKEFGKPIISTSANISGVPTPLTFNEIDTKIINLVDYVVALKKIQSTSKSSKIIRFAENKIVTLRN